MRGGGGSLPQSPTVTAPSSEGAKRNAKEGKINMIGNNSRYTAEYRRRVLRRRKLRAAAREIPEMLTAAATVGMMLLGAPVICALFR